MLVPRWKAPPADYYKVNVDASFHAATMRGGWGFVVRGSNGEVLEAGAGNLSRVSGALQAETLAVQRSLERVAQLGMSRIILEIDAATLGTALTSMEMDRSPNGCLFKQIREFLPMGLVTWSQIHICT
jgi:ribonuclease HI